MSEREESRTNICKRARNGLWQLVNIVYPAIYRQAESYLNIYTSFILCSKCNFVKSNELPGVPLAIKREKHLQIKFCSRVVYLTRFSEIYLETSLKAMLKSLISNE